MPNSAIAAQKPRPVALYGQTAGGVWLPVLVGSDGILSGGGVYTEDAAAAADPVGNALILVASDTPANRVADGDNVALIGTRKGEMRGVMQLVNSAYAAINFNSSSMTPGQNTLSTTAEVVIAANSARVFAEVTNDDAAIKVYVGFDGTVTSSNGHVLKPGASMSFEGYTGAIWCIAASGTPLVTFIEW